MATLWRNRDYMLWSTGNGLSSLGTSVSAIAFPLLILSTTGSVATAGTISAATMLGSLLTTLLGGALADRVSRKALLVVSPIVQAAALGTVAFSIYNGHSDVLLLTGMALLSGLAAGLTLGASTPALRRIVPKEQVGAATAQGLGRTMAAQLIGSPLGGVLFGLSRWVPFLADAISFVVASLSALLIRRPLGPDKTSRTNMFADLAAGIRLVWRHRYLRLTIIWGALLNMVTPGLTILVVALVKYRGGSSVEVGMVNAMALAGGIIGAIACPFTVRLLRPKRTLFVALWTFVGSLELVAFVPVPWQIGLVLLVAMTMMVPLNVVLESYEMRLVPDEYSGRIGAVSRFGMQAVQWTGPLIAGLLADSLGIPQAVLVLALGMCLLALALHVNRGTLAILDQPLEAVAEIAA